MRDYFKERGKRILVDADACPVRHVIIKVAREKNLPVIMFIDTSHQLDDSYSEVVTVDQQSTAVGFLPPGPTCRNDTTGCGETV